MSTSGVRRELARLLDRLACPECIASGAGMSSPLREGTEALVCARCARIYPVVAGIPDLRGGQEADALADLDRKAVAFYERVYVEETYGRESQDEHVVPLRELLSRIPDDAFVLELGTGLGALQGVHPGYIGTDLSIETLIKRIRGGAFAADAQRLPLRDHTVDAVFTVAVLEHIPQPERAIAEIARVLKPGGRAYLAPSWNCRTWAAEGLHVRPYGDLSIGQKLRKATIPLRDSLLWRGAFAIPKRLARRALWRLRRQPATFVYRKLAANFEVFWASDSDATAQLDPHEVALYFESRGWLVESPTTVLGRIFHRAQPLVLRRPGRSD